MLLGQHTVEGPNSYSDCDEHVWTRTHDNFKVEVRCSGWRYGQGLNFENSLVVRYNWRLYVHIFKKHKIYGRVRYSDEDSGYTYKVPKLLAHMHGGVTLEEIGENKEFIIGCDFAHWGDGSVVGCVPPEDESCLVHMYAQSLESVMLELDKKPPTLGPEDWVRFATLSDYSHNVRKIYITKLKKLV